jgi:hypothetical protein
MPKFVIERQYLVPMYQHIFVEADTFEEACEQGPATCSPRRESFVSIAANSRNRCWDATDMPPESCDN